jgi:hypothetical protein
VFGIRLPRALAAAFIDQALKASEGIAGLSVAMRGLIAIDRGPQKLHYDFWWNLPRDYMVSSEMGAAAAIR